MSANLTLVRHASYNPTIPVPDPIPNFRYSHISYIGELQARALAAELSEEEFSAIYSSPYVRALETAEIFRNFSPSAPGVFFVDSLLEERNPGNLAGNSVSVDASVSLWDINPPEIVRSYNVETLDSLMTRAESFLQKIAQSRRSLYSLSFETVH